MAIDKRLEDSLEITQKHTFVLFDNIEQKQENLRVKAIVLVKKFTGDFRYFSDDYLGGDVRYDIC